MHVVGLWEEAIVATETWENILTEHHKERPWPDGNLVELRNLCCEATVDNTQHISLKDTALKQIALLSDLLRLQTQSLAEVTIHTKIEKH